MIWNNQVTVASLAIIYLYQWKIQLLFDNDVDTISSNMKFMWLWLLTVCSGDEPWSRRRLQIDMTDAENIFVGSIYLLDLSSEIDWMPSLHIAHPQANLLRINTVIANDHQTWCYSSRELAYSINFTVAALFSKCNWILTAVNGVDNAILLRIFGELSRRAAASH